MLWAAVAYADNYLPMPSQLEVAAPALDTADALGPLDASDDVLVHAAIVARFSLDALDNATATEDRFHEDALDPWFAALRARRGRLAGFDLGLALCWTWDIEGHGAEGVRLLRQEARRHPRDAALLIVVAAAEVDIENYTVDVGLDARTPGRARAHRLLARAYALDAAHPTPGFDTAWTDVVGFIRGDFPALADLPEAPPR